MDGGSVPPTPTASPRQLVLVTGSTRSGTSMAAGTLHHLGLHVPQPVLKANDSNPAGFFESTWPVNFHRQLLDSAVVSATDSRPEAFDLVARAVTSGARAELRGWLSGVLDEAPRIVVKDPRSMWVPGLWAETADELDTTIGFLAMIRHPAEVVASRWTYYGSTRPGMDEWRYLVRTLCTWINANLGAERETRGRRRTFVRYDALLGDWRRSMRTVRDTLGIELDPALDGADSHPVDDFIDPELRRHEPTWADMDLPADLVDVAEGVWASVSVLADDDRDEATSRADLDGLGERYEELIRRSQAVAHDTMVAFARVRVQVKVMEIAAEGEPETPSIAATRAEPEPEPEVAVAAAVDATTEPGRPNPSATRIARRRMRRAFRRWVKRPLVRTA
jgi:hypothetical protein